MNSAQVERYSRQMSLFGAHGQEKLFAGKVLIIGAGGLGSPAAMYLAAAGVGQIGLVDGDKVELSNLQRHKVDSAQETLNALNPDVKIFPYNERATVENIRDIICDRDYDFVLDCTDNFATKFLINDACVGLNKSFTHAGILHYGGQLMTCLPGKSACYLGELLTDSLLTYDALTSRFRRIKISRNKFCAANF